MKASLLLLLLSLQALVLVWGSKELIQIQDIPTIDFGKVCEYASESLTNEASMLTHEEYSIEWSVSIIDSEINVDTIARRNGFTNEGLVCYDPAMCLFDKIFHMFMYCNLVQGSGGC